MFHFIASQILFFISIGIVLFIPGYFLILAARLGRHFSALELFVITFSSSIVIVDFLTILLGKSPFHITRLSVVGAIASFSAICYAIYYFSNKHKKETSLSDEMSKKSALLVVLLIFLTIFIKTIYFTDTIFPTTTDLGHHMYWTKLITITGNLPQYEKADIGSDLTINEPKPIADFIIGEHLPFAAVGLVSGIDFVSAFPSLILFLVQIMSILAIFILTREIFRNSDHRDTIAIIALLLIGPLYALASPQAKYVSGGVIGNTIGNLLIPITILFLIKAFSEKKSSHLAWALFLGLGLVYTHHLSTFVFLFSAMFAVIAFAGLNYKMIFPEIAGVLKLFLSPYVILTIAMGAIFIFFVYTPTYLNSSAIDTAVGAPSKATRTGLTLSQLKTTSGEARFAFALMGLALLFFAKNLGKYRQAFTIGWIGALALMSLKPDWLFIDIPSDRIASYIVFPVAIVAAFMIVNIFSSLKAGEHGSKNYVGPVFLLATFFIFFVFISADGLLDNAQALNSATSTRNALQTYAASQYLASRFSPNDIILKDHNYLSGDSWIKLFFMQGYNYPLSRGYFKRYTDETKNREQCTNLMISTPSSQEAQQCFAGTKTDFLMINPAADSGQFKRLRNFWNVYESDDVGIFYKAS